MDGTYGFAFSAYYGIGFGVFVIKDRKLTGYDTGGCKFIGTARADGAGLVLAFDMTVPRNSFLVPWSSEPMGVETTWTQEITLPPGFDDGKPFQATLTYGQIELMIKKLRDDAAPYATGFVMRPSPDGGGAVAP
jgi:hypothetical protein